MVRLDQFQQRATELLRKGAPLPAYDAAAAGLRIFPGDSSLRRLLALALARSGASLQANAIVAALVADGHHDEETIGLLARTFKDLWEAERDPLAARRHLEQARRWYSEAHRLSNGYWSGINAATMALLLGDRADAIALARGVSADCLARKADAERNGDAYWVTATLAEAALLAGDRSAAEHHYREAASQAHGVGDLVATRRNARLILRHQDVDPRAIDACFHIPRVALFAGHLIDKPGRAQPRFPAHVAEDVRAAVLEILRRRDIGIGYASAANGGDILFLECLDALGAEAQIVLPYNREQFLDDSVSFVDGWEARYRASLDRAAHVIVASEQRMPGNAMSYEYGFRMLDGMAALRADELDTELVCIAVWDGEPGDGPGGTAAAVEHWRRTGRQIERVDLRAITATHVAASPALRSRPEPSPPADRQTVDAQIVGLLFADVAGFSKLTEDQIPAFVERYLGEVGRTVAAFPDPPILANTWGDGLYFVFAGVHHAGAFALRLSDALRRVDWTIYGLPETLAIRIAVHAGPAYAVTDPVTGRPNYLGAHVSFAARIEPITPAGVVYGSGAFAALAKSHGVDGFSCLYVGPTPLAKGFGTTPMYVLQVRAGISEPSS